jgi:hypothetical protein
LRKLILFMFPKNSVSPNGKYINSACLRYFYNDMCFFLKLELK